MMRCDIDIMSPFARVEVIVGKISPKLEMWFRCHFLLSLWFVATRPCQCLSLNLVTNCKN